MLQIEGRYAIESVIVEGIDLLLDARSLIVGLGIGVTGQQSEWPRSPSEGGVESVVLGVAHVLVVGIGPDLVGEWITRSVHHLAAATGEDKILLERAACGRAGSHIRRLAEAEAQSGVAGIRSADSQKVTPQRADIADTQ